MFIDNIWPVWTCQYNTVADCAFMNMVEFFSRRMENKNLSPTRVSDKYFSVWTRPSPAAAAGFSSYGVRFSFGRFSNNYYTTLRELTISPRCIWKTYFWRIRYGTLFHRQSANNVVWLLLANVGNLPSPMNVVSLYFLEIRLKSVGQTIHVYSHKTVSYKTP